MMTWMISAMGIPQMAIPAMMADRLLDAPVGEGSGLILSAGFMGLLVATGTVFLFAGWEQLVQKWQPALVSQEDSDEGLMVTYQNSEVRHLQESVNDSLLKIEHEYSESR